MEHDLSLYMLLFNNLSDGSRVSPFVRLSFWWGASCGLGSARARLRVGSMLHMAEVRHAVSGWDVVAATIRLGRIPGSASEPVDMYTCIAFAYRYRIRGEL